MATTNLYAVHAGKDGDALKAVKRVIGYVENPDKTEKKKLITSYECDPRTAAEEFMLDKRAYILRTGRERGKDDVLAYHLRQSFAPGEITPDEANRLGYELAMRFTKGNHSFVVAPIQTKHTFTITSSLMPSIWTVTENSGISRDQKKHWHGSVT